ncbi:MAG: phosphotransferase [Eubacteriaceae bacterium]|nr:phosphotransferase [Eubacteriaceae bacterium]
MMTEKKKPTISEIRTILARLGIPYLDDQSIRAFVSEEDQNEYAVWLVDTGDAKRVLKQAKAYEIDVYRCFFNGGQRYVPSFLGECYMNGHAYFLTEFFPGKDLRICDQGRLTLALDALAEMQNEFWQRSELYDSCVTLEKAMEEIRIRGRYLGSEKLEKAYRKFELVYSETPRTLCHDDLLPINVLANDERAVLIDWEYGGVLPYLSSFARLIAHGREDRDHYFYMSSEDRDYAKVYFYDALAKKHGITWETFNQTLDCFLFYEYCEWIMIGNRYDARDDERYGYYMELAEQLAERLI